MGISFLLLMAWGGFLFFVNALDLFVYGLGLFIGGVLPDWIEPAHHYTHRKFFHSKRLLKWLYYSLIPLLILSYFWNDGFWLFFTIVGYISHLLADSTTTRGLPK